MNAERDFQEWVKYANEDYLTAEILLKSSRFATCAYHCQQALEKIVKATIVHDQGEIPPHSHNLRDLIIHLKRASIPEEVIQALISVNLHFRATRYPGIASSDDYTESYTQRIFEQTKVAYEWFLARLK